MADGSFPSLVSKDRDVNAVTNPIFVQLSDGTNAEGDVNVLDVIPGTGATNLGKAVDDVAGGTDVGVLALAVRDDALTTLTPVDGDYTQLRVDSTGALWVNDGGTSPADVHVDDSAFAVGTDSVGASGYLADETTPDSVDEGDVGIARMTLDRKQLFVGVDSTTDSQRWTIDSNGELAVNLPSNTETNPIFVQSVDTAVSASEVHDYDTAAAVASDATDNHDYTVVNTTFLLKSVIVSGSGNVKFEVQTGPVAGLSTVAVGFLTGRQGDTKQVFFDPAVEVPVASTGTVRIIRTNRQGAATDLYSTIIGNDV
jgi:hypothetical protein